MKKSVVISIGVGLGAAAIIYSLYACHNQLTVDNSTVSSVDLRMFMGRWYEIARFDHWFERKMSHCHTDYSMNKDGSLRIENKGMRKGEWNTSIGKAKVGKRPGILRVTFMPPFYADYRILMLAEDYSWAVIGSNSNNRLWILSRQTEIADKDKEEILLDMKLRGYDTDKLIWVDQRTDAIEEDV